MSIINFIHFMRGQSATFNTKQSTGIGKHIIPRHPKMNTFQAVWRFWGRIHA